MTIAQNQRTAGRGPRLLMLSVFDSIVDMDTRLAEQKAAGSAQQLGEYPVILDAPDWKCAEGLQQLVFLIQRGDSNSGVFFYDFLRVLDIVLSQLIVWAEAKPESSSESSLKEWAGTALAERLRFLSSQEKAWSAGNKAFATAQKKFGDRRGARTPLSYLGWLAGDYLRRLHSERLSAGLALNSKLTGGKSSAADLLGYSDERKEWLRKLVALEEFSPESAPTWARMVYERMLIDEKKILSAPEMRGRESRDAKQRAVNMEALSALPWIGVRRSRDDLHSLTLESKGQEATVRLADFSQTIVRAVIKLAEKSRGGVRGVTRP